MPRSPREVPTSGNSTASSGFPSTSSSFVHSTSNTSHSDFEPKSKSELSSSGVSNTHAISSSENQSGDIFSLSDQQLSEKMKFIQEIGFGNWGSVWLCEPRLAEERVAFGDKVAVKLVHRSKTPTTSARVRSLWNEMKIVRALRREAPAAGQETTGVGHPGVVQFHSFVITPSYALITMQYLPTPVPVEVPEFRAKPWFAALTDAVAFLHQRGVVHNDIKPANILLTGARPPMPVLVDFGFAEHYTITSRHAFQSNLAYGTPEYLAPERARGQPHDTRKSDVYALGVTFFEILVGRTPFEEVEGESFVSKEDLERYWARTVKGKWVGKWEGIMTKQCEKALKRMTVPNADLRATAMDVLNDPYFTGEEETSRSVDLSVLSDIIPPWSRTNLAVKKPRSRASIKNTKPITPKRPETSTSIRESQSMTKSAAAKSVRTADKENVQPSKPDAVRPRSGTLHNASKSITDAFRKSVGTSRKVPKKTVAEVFKEETAKKTEPVRTLKVKNSSAVLREKNSAVALREKKPINVLRESKSATPLVKEKRAVTPKVEPVQDKENAKPKSHGRTLSMKLSFSRSFGLKKAKETEEKPEAGPERRESMYFPRSSAIGTRTTGALGTTSPTASAILPSTAPKELDKVQSVTRAVYPAPIPAKGHSYSSHIRDVRSVFGMSRTPSVDSLSSSEETAAASGHTTNTIELHNEQERIQSPVRVPEEEEVASPKPRPKANTLREAGAPRLSTITQSLFAPTASQLAAFAVNKDESPISTTPTTTRTRVSKIAAKENRRTTVVAKSSPAKTRVTPVKARSSPSRTRALPAQTRELKVPVFAIGPKASGVVSSKVTVKNRTTKVLGDATNTNGSVRGRKPSQTSKVSKKSRAKEEDAHDEGDDTITLPKEAFQNIMLPRVSKESSKSIFKHSIRQSFDKAVRFGRASVSATESTHYPVSEVVQHRRSLSVGEAWGDDAVNRIVNSSDQISSENQSDRMATWIRNVEKVVEDARQSFQAGSPDPLPLPPPPPRLSHSQSAGLTRFSTSAKDPTIRTLTSHANPSLTTFAGAPQAPNRHRRATVGSISSPNASVSLSNHSHAVPQGGISRPITPCLNAELGKEPTNTAASPRLSDVLDPDSRKLILAQVGVSEHSSHPMDHDNPSSKTASKHAQNARFVKTPSPSPTSNVFPHSRISTSRPTTSMSVITSDNKQVEGAYDQYLMAHSSVVRNGKGYQSEYAARGKGIEFIVPNTNTDTYPKRNSMFNRTDTPSNPGAARSGTVSRVANAFKTMVSGGVKRREPINTEYPVVVGGGFGSTWTKAEATRRAKTWSRAQAV